MEVFTQAILPLMILIALGYIVGKLYKGDAVIFSKATLWIFANILTFSFVNSHPPKAKNVALYAISFSILFIYNIIIFKVLAKKHEMSNVYFLTSIFGNTGYLGYPVLGLALGQEAISYGVIYSVVAMIVVNTFGIAFMTKNLKESIKNLTKLPFIYAVLLGLILGYFGIFWTDFPAPIYKTIKMLSDAAIPIITVFLGVMISRIKFEKKNLNAILIASLHRLMVIPAISIFAAKLIGLKGLTYMVFVIESAMPTAMNASVISSALNEKPEVVSSEVALSTILSAITLTFWINLVAK
ncbi:MAG: AEC family transporter [Thermotogaceae bacterium]|nr:AEC family transporter [Thermotogaceae bacterium]